jgi:hypothetical protein
MLYCCQQFIQYQENEQSQKKTQHISVSALIFHGSKSKDCKPKNYNPWDQENKNVKSG